MKKASNSNNQAVIHETLSSQVLDPIFIKLWKLCNMTPTLDTSISQSQASDLEYLKLLITFQLGLFLVDDQYVLPLDKHLKVWQSLFRKSLHGYFTIKDFMRDAMVILLKRPDEAVLLQQ